MEIDCAYCGKTLNRPPSRVKANVQFCDHACHTAHQQRSRVETACAQCGKHFTNPPSQSARRRYDLCSQECRLAFLSQSRARLSGEARNATCAHCGKSFTRKPSQIAKYPTSFCSRECKRLGQVGIPHPEHVTGEWLPCEACGKQVWRTPATKMQHVFCGTECQRVRVTINCAYCGTAFSVIKSQAHKRRACSGECKRALLGERWMGDGNPLWRDGSSNLPYAPGFTPALKRKIRRRDHNRCRACGIHETESRLDVHHIDWLKTNHDPANLITLCLVCHANIHHRTLTLLPLALLTPRTI